MSEPQSVFHPRPVYVAASYMSRVGKYNGTHLEALTFVDLAEQVSQIFQDSSVRREGIEAVVVGSQNPFAFSHMDNVAAKIAGLLGISGAKSVLIDTASRMQENINDLLVDSRYFLDVPTNEEFASMCDK